VDSKNVKYFMFCQVKTRKEWHQEGVEFVQHTNKEKKPVLCAQLAVWHFAKLCFSKYHMNKNY
jgi:hypothetical protein